MYAPLAKTLNAASVGEFNQTLRSSAWDVDFVQINRGASPVHAIACETPSVALLQVELGNRVHQKGSPPPGMLTYGIPRQSKDNLRWGRREIKAESILAFSHSTGLDAVTDCGYGAYTLSITPERIAACARILGQRKAEDKVANHSEVRHPDPRRLRGLHRVLDFFFHEAARVRPSPAMPALTAMIESELPLLFLQAWDGSSLSDGMRARPRMQALRRATDYIEAYSRNPITIPDLCRAASCSLSTLNRAFREHYGVSPKRYLTAIRLAGVRRALMTGATRGVSGAAAEWGFWHLSKFTADYKQMFGELPSATLSRATSAPD